MSIEHAARAIKRETPMDARLFGDGGPRTDRRKEHRLVRSSSG